MRMGRPTKPRKSSRKNNKNTDNTSSTLTTNRPKFSSPTLVVGQISSNVIESIYSPALYALAVASVENYADAILAYDEQTSLALTAMSGDAANATHDYDDDDDVEVIVEGGEEAELDLDGSLKFCGTSGSSCNNNDVPQIINPLPPPSSHRLLFTTQHDIDELSSLLRETSAHFSTPSNSWKIHANAAKFERLLDEKYGKFRPFIESHPNVELFIKNVQRKYAMGAFSPLRKGNAPINKTTAIMILFMMHRNNVKWEALILVATFCLVGLQPWALVTLVAVGKWEMERRKGRRVYGMPKKLKVCEPYYARGVSISSTGAKSAKNADEEEESEEEERAKKYALLEKPVGTKFNPADLSLRDEKFDVLLLGCGVDTLYTAALLARAGRKVCVLSPTEDVSECVVMEKTAKDGSMFANVPFDIKGMNISHLSKQQTMLAPALVTNTDTQGGIRFARIGSPCDGYAHSILSVPGLGMDKINAESIPIVINAEGSMALADYCANYLGDGFPCIDSEGNDSGNNSMCLGYIKACQQINAVAGEYYLSKLFASTGSSESNVYQQASIRPVSAFLNQCLPLNTHVRSLMAAIGMTNENLSPDNTSMAAHVTHLCAMLSEEGVAYPIGGPRALCHALTSVIEQCDGRVLSGLSLQELLFEKLPEKSSTEDETKDNGKKKLEGSNAAASTPSNETNTDPKPRCRGVRLQNGCEVTVSDGGGAVLSFLGFIPTFLHLLPSDIRTAHGVPPGLPAVSERRPLMKILVGLKGTKEELDLTGADWYRLPNATLPRDELDPVTGQVKFGTIGVDESDDEAGRILPDGDSTIEGETLEPSTSQDQSGRRKKHESASSSASLSTTKKAPRSKFTPGESWMKVSFPSAKDPSWQDRYGSVSTCVITVEAGDDFVRMFDTKPKIYSILSHGSSLTGEVERLRDRVLKDLVDTFPQLEGERKIIKLSLSRRSSNRQLTLLCIHSFKKATSRKLKSVVHTVQA